MPRFRLRFTIRWIMAAVVVLGLVMTALVSVKRAWEARRQNLLRELRAANFAAAEAGYQNARLTREVAEIAVTEYRDGIFEQDLATARGEIALAESDLKRASDKFTLRKARFSLEQANTRKDVLEKYTRGKTIKELQSEVEKARAVENAAKATRDREKAALQAPLEAFGN